MLPFPKQKHVPAGYVIPPRKEGDPYDTPGFLAAIRESSQALDLVLMDEESEDVDWSDLSGDISDDFCDDKPEINQQMLPMELSRCYTPPGIEEGDLENTPHGSWPPFMRQHKSWSWP